MKRYKTCIRCDSTNIDKVKVNTRINLCYPEERGMGCITQRILNPTDAVVCKECGHIEFFVNWTE